MCVWEGNYCLAAYALRDDSTPKSTGTAIIRFNQLKQLSYKGVT